jgi:hypothetical protein
MFPQKGGILPTHYHPGIGWTASSGHHDMPNSVMSPAARVNIKQRSKEISQTEAVLLTHLAAKRAD